MRIDHTVKSSKVREVSEEKQETIVENFLDLLARLIARQHLRRSAEGDEAVAPEKIRENFSAGEKHGPKGEKMV